MKWTILTIVINSASSSVNVLSDADFSNEDSSLGLLLGKECFFDYLESDGSYYSDSNVQDFANEAYETDLWNLMSSGDFQDFRKCFSLFESVSGSFSSSTSLIDVVIDHFRGIPDLSSPLSVKLDKLEHSLQKAARDNFLVINDRFIRRMMWYIGAYATSLFRKTLTRKTLVDAFVELTKKQERRNVDIIIDLISSTQSPWKNLFLSEVNFFIKEEELMRDLSLDHLPDDWETLCVSGDFEGNSLKIMHAFADPSTGRRGLLIALFCANVLLESRVLVREEASFASALIKDLDKLMSYEPSAFFDLHIHLDWTNLVLNGWDMVWRGRYDAASISFRFGGPIMACICGSINDSISLVNSLDGLNSMMSSAIASFASYDITAVERFRRLLWSLHVNTSLNAFSRSDKKFLIVLFKSLEDLLKSSGIADLRQARVLIWKNAELLERVSLRDTVFVSEIQEMFTEALFRNLVIAEWKSKSGKIKNVPNRDPIDWLQYYDSFTNEDEKIVITDMLMICKDYAIGLFVSFPFPLSNISSTRSNSIMSLIKKVFSGESDGAEDLINMELSLGNFRYVSDLYLTKAMSCGSQEESETHVLLSLIMSDLFTWIVNDPDHLLSDTDYNKRLHDRVAGKNLPAGFTKIITVLNKIFYSAEEPGIETIIGSTNTLPHTLQSITNSLFKQQPNTTVNLLLLTNLLLKMHSSALSSDDLSKIRILHSQLDLLQASGDDVDKLEEFAWSMVDDGFFEMAMRVFSKSLNPEWHYYEFMISLIKTFLSSPHPNIGNPFGRIKICPEGLYSIAFEIVHSSCLRSNMISTDVKLKLKSIIWMWYIHNSKKVPAEKFAELKRDGINIRHGNINQDSLHRSSGDFALFYHHMDVLMQKKFMDANKARDSRFFGVSGFKLANGEEQVPYSWRIFFKDLDESISGVIANGPQDDSLTVDIVKKQLVDEASKLLSPFGNDMWKALGIGETLLSGFRTAKIERKKSITGCIIS